MIKYALTCSKAHAFEGWFRSADDFDAQSEAGQIICPHCGDAHVQKALMAPNVAPKEPKAKAPQMTSPEALKRNVEERLRALRAHVEANATYVGGRFAEEARKRHEAAQSADPQPEAKEEPASKEAPSAPTATDAAIYGEATAEEAQELIEEGVPFAPIPWINRRDD